MKRILRLLLKIIGGLVILGLVTFGIVYALYNEPLPQGKMGPEANALGQKIGKAINIDAYRNTRFLEWSFAGGAHQYHWDKENGTVIVQWDAYTVDLNLNDIAKSTVVEEGANLTAKESKALYTKAWDYFNNDSFWLVAPFKVFDKGTERRLILLEDGSEGLLVTYTNGGSTPGDSYLWRVNANGFPERFQMWVGIIPIGGIKASWEEWQIMESGVFLPISHKLGPITLSMGKVKAYN